MHGYQHTTLNLAVLAPLWAVGLAAGRAPDVHLFGAGYLIGTLLITPDLDLRFNDAARRWGVLRFVWTPYHLLSRHRGMSHTYLLGPLSRLLYLTAWVVPLLLLGGAVQLKDLTSLHLASTSPGPVLAALQVMAGYLVSQWMHLMADGIWPFMPARASRRRA